MKSGPSVRPRTGGGFNPGGMGSMGGEHLDENALQAAAAAKQTSQQAADPSTAQAAAAAANQPAPGSLTAPVTPREVGSFKDELITRPAKDIVQGLKSLFDINAALGVDPKQDTPEEQSHKRQLHQRWMKLNQDQQQLAQKNYQQEMQEKKQAEEDEQLKEQQAAEAKNSGPIVSPSGSKKGPVGPAGSKKQKATNQLQQQRQQMGGGAQPKH